MSESDEFTASMRTLDDASSATSVALPPDIADDHPLIGDSLNLAPDEAGNQPGQQEQPTQAPSASRTAPSLLETHFRQFSGRSEVIQKASAHLDVAQRTMQKSLELDMAAAVSAAGDASAATNAFGAGLEAWLLQSWHDDDSVRFLGLEPRLLVFGGPGSGKSSLINRLLGEDVLPIGSSLVCQAGLIYLHYSEAAFVRFSGPNTRQRAPRKLDSDRPLAGQIRSFLQTETDEAERRDWAELVKGCILEVGASCQLLRATRLGFVEVPSDCVDHRVRERLLRELSRSPHRAVVYVIDSQKGFCNQDREFLMFLRANRPEDRVIFAANKVDYDPMAEMMDRGSDDDSQDSEGDGAEGHAGEAAVHASGVETQRRKLRLVDDQLRRYHLLRHETCRFGDAADAGCCVFPLSLLRLRVPLKGAESYVRDMNSRYQQQFGQLEGELAGHLYDTGSQAMDSATCALYLKAAFAFDVFARDTAKEEKLAQASRQQLITKEFIRQCMMETRDSVDEMKRRFRGQLSHVLQDRQEWIVAQCCELEFGPLRLSNRIRSNEVEQQYRTQINNYLLHLLNTDVVARMSDTLVLLKTDLVKEIVNMQEKFTVNSHGGVVSDSQWNSVVRMQVQDAQATADRMQLSVEWETDFKFFTWMRRLVTKKGASGSAMFSSGEWKASVAREFYEQISTAAVVKKFFATFDAKLHQVEQGLSSLLTARQRCGTRLRRLLRRGHPEACSAWLASQIALAAADALRNLQRFGLLSDDHLAPDCGGGDEDGRLGRQRRLRLKYGGLQPGRHSATVLSGVFEASGGGGRIGSVCGLFLARAGWLRCKFADSAAVVCPLMVTLTSDFQLCVLHSAFSHSLAAAIAGYAYSERQAFQLLASLLRLCESLVLAAGAPTSDAQTDSWSLRCERIKVRFDADETTAMFDCLEESLQVTRPKKKKLAPLLQPQQSQQLQTDMRQMYKRSRSHDLLSSSAQRPSPTDLRWREQLDNLLSLATMILCRSCSVEFAHLPEWPAIAAAAAAAAAADDEPPVDRLRRCLADGAAQLDASRFVIPEPWACISQLAFGEGRKERIGWFINSGLAGWV